MHPRARTIEHLAALPHGKFAGVPIADVDPEYCVWLVTQRSWVKRKHPGVWRAAVRRSYLYLKAMQREFEPFHPWPGDVPMQSYTYEELVLRASPLPAEILEML